MTDPFVQDVLAVLSADPPEKFPRPSLAKRLLRAAKHKIDTASASPDVSVLMAASSPDARRKELLEHAQMLYWALSIYAGNSNTYSRAHFRAARDIVNHFRQLGTYREATPDGEPNFYADREQEIVLASPGAEESPGRPTPPPIYTPRARAQRTPEPAFQVEPSFEIGGEEVEYRPSPPQPAPRPVSVESLVNDYTTSTVQYANIFSTTIAPTRGQ